MAKLKAQKCPSCMAPVEIRPEDNDVTCRYCGQPIHIEHKKRPKVAQLPPEVQVRTIYVDPHAGRMRGLFFLPALLPAAIGVYTAIRMSSVHSSINIGGESSVSSLPARCSLNGRLVIEGKTLTTSEPAISTAINCKVVIKNSTIKAPRLIEGSDTNVTLELENSTLEGDSLIDLGFNGQVIAKKSKIIAKRTAITGKANLKLTLDNSKIEAGERAVVADSNPNIKMSNGAKIDAKETAVTGGVNLELDLDGSVIQGGEIGVKASTNPKIRMAQRSEVRGNKTAILAGHNLDLNGRESLIEGGQIGVEAESAQSVELRKMHVKGASAPLAIKRSSTPPNLVDTQLIGGSPAATSTDAKRPAAKPLKKK